MARRSKYGNKRTQRNGYTFDSKAEARRHGELLLLVRAGLIRDLECQPTLELQPKFKRDGKTHRAITYRADFVYTDCETGARVIEDVKGKRTAVFNLKWKLALAKYPEYEFRLEAA